MIFSPLDFLPMIKQGWVFLTKPFTAEAFTANFTMHYHGKEYLHESTQINLRHG